MRINIIAHLEDTNQCYIQTYCRTHQGRTRRWLMYNGEA